MNQHIDAAWKYWKLRDQDGWIRGCRSPLCPANTSKILLHVKQFSLKTNWRVAKGVFYNQDCKKHPQTQSWVGKEKKKSDQDLCPKEMTERKGNTRVCRFYQGSEQFDSQARHPSFVVQHQDVKSPWLLWKQWDWQRSSKKPRCDLWRAGTCLLTPETRQRKELKLPATLARFAWPLSIHLNRTWAPAPGAPALRCTSPLGWRLLQLRICIVAGIRTSQVLVGTQEVRHSLGFDRYQDCPSGSPVHVKHPLWYLMIQVIKVKVSVQKGGKTTLRRKGPPYTWYLGLLPPIPPTPVLLPGKSHGQRSLVGCSPWGRKESDTTEWLHFHFSLSYIGEGNGNPLQCSCLENPRDGGACCAAVSGVA